MHNDLPPMLKPAEAAAFLRVSRRALDRLLAIGLIPCTKLGTGRSAPVRIPRDGMLRALGLIGGETERRRRRAAEAERHLAEAELC